MTSLVHSELIDGVKELGIYLFKQWLVAAWRQVITLTNTELLSTGSDDVDKLSVMIILLIESSPWRSGPIDNSLFQVNVSENVVCTMSAILFNSQCAEYAFWKCLIMLNIIGHCETYPTEPLCFTPYRNLQQCFSKIPNGVR